MSSSSFGVYQPAALSCESVTARERCLLDTALRYTSRCDAEGHIARLYTVFMQYILYYTRLYCILLDAEICFHDVIPAYRC